MQYVGETGRKCVKRFGEHIYYVGKFTEATGTHFNEVGHSSADIEIHIIEKVTPNTKTFRLKREEFLNNKLRTYKPHGLNTNT